MAGDLILCGTYTHPSLQAGFEVTPARPVMGMAGPTGSAGVYVFARKPGAWELSPLAVSDPVENPSFLILDRAGRYVFAVSELRRFHGQPHGAVCSFALDPDSGRLQLISRVSSGGGNPCHLSFSPDELYLFVANHEGGSIAVIPVSQDGRLSEFVHLHADAPVDERQPHAHFVTPDRAGRFVLATNTTTDRISVFRQDPDTGKLTLHEPPWATTHPGGSPRHLAFTPSGDYLLANGEADLTLSLFRYDGGAGVLTYKHCESTTPDRSNLEGQSTSQLLAHPNGRDIYVGNRGADTVAHFALDKRRGEIVRIGVHPTFGKTPRNFQIDPSGSFLYVANQNSDSIECFAIDPQTGTLERRGRAATVPAPTCIQFR